MAESRAGTDFLQLQRGDAPPGALTTWLVDSVRAAVADGRLTAGSPMPATRTLAADLAISRGVVVEAYRRLADEGLITARTGAGTIVTAPIAAQRPRPASAIAPSPAEANARRIRTTRPAPPLLPREPAEVDLDLSPGVPDLAAFPRAAWLRAERAVLRQASGSDLGYGDPRGSRRLRVELASWLARNRGIRADPDDVIVVAGVAQSLALLAQTLHAQGIARIAVEDPGSRGARVELSHWGLESVPVAVDEHGLDVDELTATGVQVALLTPAHQFPTGVVLAPQRRHALLDWAVAGGLIIEDDYDAEHRYDRAPVPALQASAPDYVAHTGSTSKTLAPGMRLGWLVPPRRLQAILVAAKHASDLGSPALAQLVLAHLLANGEYDRHIRMVRGRQRARRDAVLAAVREHLPQAHVGGIAAGLHVLLTLPDGTATDDAELADQVRQVGVLVHPLSWHRQRPGSPGLVLGYAAHPPDRLREAVRRIARAIGSS